MPFDGTLRQDDEILRVLRAAQERIEKPENWCQGNPGFIGPDLTGRVCASMALWAVCGGRINGGHCPLDRPARVHLKRAVRQFGYQRIGEANDRGGHDVSGGHGSHRNLPFTSPALV